MQHPEIFEQPVASKDPESQVAGDENGTSNGTIYSSGLLPATGRDDDASDYRDFVYPEGWFPPCCFFVQSSET